MADRESLDHYFGDPRVAGSSHPDARPPLEPLEAALDAFLDKIEANEWRVKTDGDTFVEVQVYDGEAPGHYRVNEDGSSEELDGADTG